MATKVQSSQEKIAEMESKVEQAFRELMTLVAPANQTRVIELWVQGTHNAKYVGWEKGYDAGSGEI